MWKLREINLTNNIKEIDEHPLIKRLLSQRNVGDLNNFFSKNPKNSIDPFQLHGVKDACLIFQEIIEKNGEVTIIGDYDADGVVSTTMAIELCKNFGLEYNFFIPSRLKHGYGLNPKTIEHFKKNYNPTDLLMVLDCGGNNFDEIQELRDFGFNKIIVIDHHIMGEKISKNADTLISWHLSDDEYKEEMCTTGEIFQFVRGLKKMGMPIDPLEFITYAAIGTIADVSPVVGTNRVIVDKGLTSYALDHVLSSGLNSLFNKVGVNREHIVPDDIGFKIAPRINAVGRLDDPSIVVSLLTEHEPVLANKITDHVCKYNDDRKDVQKKIEDKIDYYIENGEYEHGILIIDKEWHIGVVGIVASRVVEKYKKPTVVVGSHNGIYKGSGRTVEGVNLKEILDSCSQIFSNYGGHAGAVGVTLDDNYLDDANKIFNQACKNYYETHEISGGAIIYYDANLKLETVNPDTAQLLIDKMSPYCKEHNPEPIFKLTDVNICNVEHKSNDKWSLIKFNVSKGDFLIDYPFICWNSDWDSNIEGCRADIYFKFPQSWGHGKYDSFQLKLEHVNIL